MWIFIYIIKRLWADALMHTLVIVESIRHRLLRGETAQEQREIYAKYRIMWNMEKYAFNAFSENAIMIYVSLRALMVYVLSNVLTLPFVGLWIYSTHYQEWHQKITIQMEVTLFISILTFLLGIYRLLGRDAAMERFIAKDYTPVSKASLRRLKKAFARESPGVWDLFLEFYNVEVHALIERDNELDSFRKKGRANKSE